ncbi:unnamed protein product [Sphagnum compactum]
MANSYGLKGKGVDLSQGPPKRKGDAVQIPDVIETPLVPAENAPSSSGWHSNVKYLVHDLNPACNSNNPNLTIVFFHGIAFGTNDEWKETWTTWPTNNREECICWPEKWLPQDLNNNVRILSLSYDSNIVASVHNDVIEIGKNLVQSLITNSNYQSLWDGPVALIAYSFGGLVLKSLVVEARKHVNQSPRNDFDDEVHKCCKTFLNNVKGVVFYGVPHAGGTQYLSHYFTWQCQQINTLSKSTTQSGFLKNLESFNPQMEHLSMDFKNAVHEDLNIYAFGEGLPLDEHWGILVPFASAIQLSNNNHYKIEDANHLTICKPPNKDHPSYFLLLKCLKICMENILLPPLPCHEVALIDKAKDINILLQKESIVGLVGMGGIGKTTLCKKFYHLFHNQYDKSSFLEDVKSKDNINDVIKQLLHDLCGKRLCKDENVNKKDLDQIRQCMKSEKVLVVVDDVDKAENLTSLQLIIDKSAKNATSKSKVLVNCRNWQNLKPHVSEDGKVVMKSLEKEQARELFMFHAFGNANHVPTKDFKDICMKIIKACGGLPLSLKVLGSFLCNTKDLEIWKGALSKLKSGQSFTGGNDNEELWSKLKISYDYLDKQHQNMFLDIACFLGGLKISTICRAWSGDYLHPKFGLQNLQHRSLIQWGESRILYIHEQLRDMGQNIAMELPVMNRFIWKSNKPNSFLQKDEVVENLEGISLKKCFNSLALAQIGSKGFHNLRLVDLTEASPTIVKMCMQRRNLNNVKWLCFKKCMIRKLPSNLFYCSQLKVLDLTECLSLENIPSSIGQLNALQEFNLNGCSNLKELPSSIGRLNALQELDLNRCSKLKKLPSSIGQLNALQQLSLSQCSNLKELPSSIGQLNALQQLYLWECSNLKELPSSIGQLNALQQLYLWECSNLKELPSSIGQLNALQQLDLSKCSNLKELPSSIGQLNALQQLSLSKCSNLKELPSSIGQLNALQLFLWSECSNLKKLPSSIGQLNALQHLYLWRCSNLKELPSSIGQLNALQELYLSECSNLKELPSSIGQLNALQELYLSECSNLKELPSSIGQLNALEKLDLSECSNLKELPSSIGQLNALKKLYLSKCSNLKELPSSIGQLNALEKLYLSKCSNLKELPSSIGQLNALQELDLGGCSNLKELPSSIGQLNALQQFYLSECSNLKELPPSIGQLNALEKFNLSKCSNLKELPSSIGQLNALEKLYLSKCSNLKELPSSIGQLNALQQLDLSECSNLKELPSSIGQLNALQALDLMGCSNLKKLPSSIGQLNALQKLYLNGCCNLKELPSSIGQLNALQALELMWCFNLKKLPSSIGQLNALQKLYLNGCCNLKELPSSIGQLNALQKFF